MQNAKNGDKVKVHYTGKLDNGQVFDSSEGKDPLEFTIGENQLLKKFEEAVDGLEVGESTKVVIPAEEAYGTRQEQLIAKVPKEKLPEGMEPEVGMKLQTQTPEGQVMVVNVTEVNEENITIDANHELADEDLHFDIKLVEIV